MNDRGEPVTRLGPNSGGRVPRDPAIRTFRWDWGSDDPPRPGTPWIGIFLLVFGGLLLVQQLIPQFRSLGSIIVLAIGLAFLVRWVIDRGTGSLYAGAIITALAVPGVLNAVGIEANGLGTFSLGVAFVFIGAVRAFSKGSLGWQIWFGGLLMLVGGASIAGASFAGLLLPIVLVGLGVVLIAGGRGRPFR